MRFLRWLGIVILLLIVIYFTGPQPPSPQLSNELPAVPGEALALEKYIHDHEALHKLKPDNEARIVWLHDSLKDKTEYAVVYLHGFSASQEEGNPVHYDFAKKFGCNLFLSRLADHGLDTAEPLVNITADKLWNSAKEAFAIGKQLGEKIILMATSTGGTLALKLAAEYPEIAGLILLSPNVAINDNAAWLLNNHWGLQIARMIKGNYIHARDTTALYRQYWYQTYRIESAVQLEELIEETMKESTFRRITQPTLLLYYYKDDKNQDPVVKVTAMKRMFTQLSTPDGQKRQIAIPNAGDHVIGSFIKSKDIKTVEEECEKFGKEILKLNATRQ
jgi:pimeloyl-ACP methyl ester carboxylesterase